MRQAAGRVRQAAVESEEYWVMQENLQVGKCNPQTRPGIELFQFGAVILLFSSNLINFMGRKMIRKVHV